MASNSDYFSYPTIRQGSEPSGSSNNNNNNSFAAPPLRHPVPQFVPGPYPPYHSPQQSQSTHLPPTQSNPVHHLPPMITSENSIPPVFVPLSQISPYPSPELSAWDTARLAGEQHQQQQQQLQQHSQQQQQQQQQQAQQQQQQQQQNYSGPPSQSSSTNGNPQWAHYGGSKQEQEERYHLERQQQEDDHQRRIHEDEQHRRQQQEDEQRYHTASEDQRSAEESKPRMVRNPSANMFPQQQLAYPREESGGEKKTHAPSKPFPAKLAFLLQHPDLYSDVIRWNYDGTSFVISLIDRLIIEVLPQLFFHQSMAAFTRQLNTYGFNHLTNTDVISQFHPSSTTPKSLKSLSGWTHPLFTRDNPSTLHLLAPKPSRARELQQQVRTAFLEKERGRVGSRGRREY